MGRPSRPAARQISARSPDGSAAASSTSLRVSAGNASSWRAKLSSMRPISGVAPGRPNPPASSAGVSPRGSSSSASGFPRVSAMIRSRTRASSGPASADSSSVRAASSCSPPTSSSANPASSSPGSRAANTRPTGSAASRRAVNPSTWAEARSSQCTSSTRHISARSPATSDSKPSTASPSRNRSGGGPAATPSAVSNASRCGTGSCPARLSIGAHSWCSPANASSISDCTPTTRTTWYRESDARPARYSSSAVLPAPGSPRTTSARLSPAPTASTSRSSAPHSARRSVSPVARRRRPESAIIPTHLSSWRSQAPGQPQPAVLHRPKRNLPGQDRKPLVFTRVTTRESTGATSLPDRDRGSKHRPRSRSTPWPMHWPRRSRPSRPGTTSRGRPSHEPGREPQL